jgi:hypothetical protein
MNEAIVMRCHLHVVQLTQSRQLSALGEASVHCGVKLQDGNCFFLQEGPTTEARVLTLTTRPYKTGCRHAGMLAGHLIMPKVGKHHKQN